VPIMRSGIAIARENAFFILAPILKDVVLMVTAQIIPNPRVKGIPFIKFAPNSSGGYFPASTRYSSPIQVDLDFLSTHLV